MPEATPGAADPRRLNRRPSGSPVWFVASTVEWVRKAVGWDTATVRVLPPDIEEGDSAPALHAMGAELRLAADLLRAETPVSAVRSAARLCSERLGVPVAGLVPDRSGTGWSVAAAYGLNPIMRARLRRSVDEMSVITGHDHLLRRLAERFAEIVGRDDAEAIAAGAAVLLMADASFAQGEFVQTVASLLGEALERIGSVGRAQLRNENLDLALACTAHELRGPLVGARAALDRVTAADDPNDQELLRRTKDELRQLSDLVDPLLRWSAGSAALQMRRTDLVSIVGDAVASCGFQFSGRSVRLNAPHPVPVRADARELRGAVANVVRNALEYSPATSSVSVNVDIRENVAQVRVRDRGAGVPAAERHLIFDPFARGSVGRVRRGGKGLGLFIARRVVEAHGGAIGLRPVRSGAEFCIELPLADGRSVPCAS